MPDGLFNQIVYILTYTDFHPTSVFMNSILAGFAASLICMGVSFAIAIPSTIVLKIFSWLGERFLPEVVLGGIMTFAINLVLVVIALVWLALLLCTLFLHGIFNALAYAAFNLFFSWIIYRIWYELFGFKPTLPYI